ncbi:MAG: MATE family efflux transporter [Lachnospiraceae bacterium]|nr:MATE family efflux transporter [Lachnospiraceae bacterium]
MNKDLTQGKPEQVLWSFCLPLFGSIIFQQLYNIADSLIAGKFVGENALAAVGNSYEITLIFIAFAFGCNIGCSVIVSRYFGAKEYHHVKTAVHTTLIGGGILCALLMLAGFTGCSFLLKLIRTPAEIMGDSWLYLMIYIAGLPFLFFYNIATGIFSALGDSKTPFYFLACSSTANIAMDYVFVKYLQMGVAGVAWATFICQGISCILAMVVVFRHLKALKSEKKSEIFSGHIFKQICIVAVPSILQQSFISIGNIIIQSLINGFGPAVIAGYAAAIKLNNLVITSFTTLGNGISNYTAQNMGAGKHERIHSGFKAGLKMVWILCVPIVLVYLLFGKGLVFLFMDSAEGPAIETGVQILRILAPFYFVVSVKLVADGVLRGASLMTQFMTATFTDLILRVVLAALLSRFMGVIGIWSAWPIGWLIGTAVSLFFYRYSVKKHPFSRVSLSRNRLGRQ